MRHEHTVKYPCPACGCPIIQIATYCCSDVADLICNGCDTTSIISDKEASEIQDNNPYAVLLCGEVTFYRPLPERDPVFKSLPKLGKLTDEEVAEFQTLMEKYGYAPKGSRIGFVGNRQVIFPAIETEPPEEPHE